MAFGLCMERVLILGSGDFRRRLTEALRMHAEFWRLEPDGLDDMATFPLHVGEIGGEED
jgi:hypothetical protein